MRHITCLLFVTILCSWCPVHAQSDVEIDELSRVTAWTKIANGVFATQIGKQDAELRYTTLAGAPPRPGALNRLPDVPLTSALKEIRYRISEDHKVLIRIPTEPDEKIYGFGLQFDNTMKTGRILELQVDHFAKGGGATHAPVPFYISSKGYGVFFNSAKFLKLYIQIGNRKDSPRNPAEVDRNPPADEKQAGRWLAQPPGDAVEASIHGEGLELIGFTGVSLQDIVARYNLFCGGGAMPPLWGLGFWHRVPAKFSAQETEKEIAEFKEHRIPLDVVGLEPGWQTKSYPCTFEWQPKRFPEPADFVKRLLDDGLRLNLWENPYVSKHARIYEDLYPLSGSHMVWLGIVPDYRLTRAREILIAQHKLDHFDLGVSGYKIDEVDGYDVWLWPDHASFPSGASGELMRQTYGLLLQDMLYKDLFHKHNQRTYSLVRGSNGAASHYPFVLYSDSYGHEQYVTGLSTASLSGILWCPEIRSARSSREWINRMHTACFSPLAMLNAWSSGTKPWSYPEATDAVRRTIQLRMRLLPYLYTAFHEYRESGIPTVRAMILEGGSGPGSKLEEGRGGSAYAEGFRETARDDTSMFMFGRDILVAPFLNDSIERVVQLPTGDWYDFYTGKLAGNGNSITVTAKQTNDLPPLFVKDGALIPMLKQSVDRTRDMRSAELELRHYGKRGGACLLYEDDGETFDFEQGAFRLRRLRIQSGELLEAVITDGAPAFYGTLTLREMTQ